MLFRNEKLIEKWKYFIDTKHIKIGFKNSWKQRMFTYWFCFSIVTPNKKHAINQMGNILRIFLCIGGLEFKIRI